MRSGSDSLARGAHPSRLALGMCDTNRRSQREHCQVTIRATLDSSTAKGLIALAKDRERAAPLVAQLKEGARAWEDLTKVERRLLLLGPPLIELLQDKGSRLRFDDPEEMLSALRTACALADSLGFRRYGKKVVSDLRAQAWAELANAYRIADDMEGAGSAFARAREWAQMGTNSDAVYARLFELLALYLSDLRRFSEAIGLLEKSKDLYFRCEDTEAFVRSSICLGLVLGYSNEQERAIVAFLAAIRCIEHQSPLRLSAIHGLTLNLVDAGFCEAAQSIVIRNRRLYRRSGKLNEYRLFWLEGKIATGLQDYGRAEAKLNTARLAFTRVKQTYDAALVALDLALVYVHQNRHQEVIWLVDEMLRTFRTLGIGRESIASLLLLRKSCEQRRSVDMLCGQIELLAKLMPELRRQGKKNPEES
jgi:tetratricopeptide (TPR) repeat protein